MESPVVRRDVMAKVSHRQLPGIYGSEVTCYVSLELLPPK